MDMSAKHKDFVDNAKRYLLELVPQATEISFEELTTSLSMDNPPNAMVVTLGYKDSGAVQGVQGLFSKKVKSIYMNPDTKELLAVKNKLF